MNIIDFLKPLEPGTFPGSLLFSGGFLTLGFEAQDLFLLLSQLSLKYTDSARLMSKRRISGVRARQTSQRKARSRSQSAITAGSFCAQAGKLRGSNFVGIVFVIIADIFFLLRF